MKCPGCGADLIENGKLRFCEYCGYEEKDRSPLKDYNVLLNCINTASPVDIAVPDSGIVISMQEGGVRSLNLVQGPHNISFAAGKARTSRVIYVGDNDDVVKIDFSYSPDRRIPIDLKVEQPDTRGDIAGESNGKLPPNNSVLALLSTILAFTFIGAPVGFILGVIDLIISKRAGRQPNQLALVGSIIGFGIVFLYLMIRFLNWLL